MIKRKILQAFPAFQYRNYRLYFAGQLVSLIGTWLQTVGQGWLVLELTNSAFWVGFVTALSMIPVLFLGLFAGTIIDRYKTNTIIIITQIIQIFLAFALGILAITGVVVPWHIAVLALLLGIVTAFDMPARQTYMVELVERKHLASAVALNSATFNAARIIGPAIAGLLIVLVHAGGLFILNGLSFLPVLWVLYTIRHHSHPGTGIPISLKAVLSGLHYTASHRTIRTLLIVAAVSATFGWSYASIMPYIAKHVFNQDAGGLGWLYAATGVGALAGTVVITAVAHVKQPVTVIIIGNIVFAGALILFSLTNTMFWGMFWLFFVGLGLIVQFSMTNTTIQHLVADNMRGRVMSLYTTTFMGFGPFGSFLIGYLADRINAPIAVRLCSFVSLLFAIGVYCWRKRLFSDQEI